MEKKLNSVAVLVPTYNHENYILSCLEGIENQLGNFEICVFVYDDCSSDSTVQKIKKFSKTSRITFDIEVGSTNIFSVGGKPVVGKLLPKASRFDFVAICDGDDIWIDKLKIEKQIKILERMPNVALVYGAVIAIDESNNPCDIKNQGANMNLAAAKLRQGCPINTSTVLFRAQSLVIDKILRAMPYGDLALWSHLGSSGSGFFLVGNPLTAYRKHTNSITSSLLKTDVFITDAINYYVLFLYNLKRGYRLDALNCLGKSTKQLLKYYLK